MPILPVIYIVVATALFGGGYFYGWSGEHDEVVALEQQLNTINAQSQKLLSDTQAHNLEQTIKQQEQIADIEAKYNEQTQTNDSLHDQLITAQRVRRTASAARDCHTVSKIGDITRNQKNDAGGLNPTLDTTGFSENFDLVISRKALEADKIASERKLLLDWIKTIPPEMIQ